MIAVKPKKDREPHLEVKPYNAPNWYTRSGVELKRRAIEKKGLPPWKQCLFITLTLDQVVDNRVDSYELGCLASNTSSIKARAEGIVAGWRLR
ncbi:MAG: hypothetical protein AAFX93_20570, partial [Verrucomicrobiota bacterium]